MPKRLKKLSVCLLTLCVTLCAAAGCTTEKPYIVPIALDDPPLLASVETMAGPKGEPGIWMNDKDARATLAYFEHCRHVKRAWSKEK